MKEKIVELKRLGNRIIAINLVLDEDIIHIISACAPQVGLDESVRSQFWDEMDGLLREIPTSEKIFRRGDLNGHVGKDNKGYDRVHGGQGFGEKNESRDTTLDFALAFDLVTANICIKKREEHLITYKSRTSKS